MRGLFVSAMVVATAGSLAMYAQDGGVTASGWEVRLDNEGDASEVLSFMEMGGGVHATTSAAGGAIFWQPNSMAKEDYTISASFTQAEASNHPNGYGLIFGGANLADDNQQYSYFLIRQGGEFFISQRMGDDTSTVTDWTAHDAINDLDDDGRATNVLSVEAAGDEVNFLVNDTVVATQPRSGLATDGITGLRVNHFLNVHIDQLDLGMM